MPNYVYFKPQYFLSFCDSRKHSTIYTYSKISSISKLIKKNICSIALAYNLQELNDRKYLVLQNATFLRVSKELINDQDL